MAQTLSGNPALNEKHIDEYLGAATGDVRTMSILGTAFKTLIFLVALVAAAAFGWQTATEPVATDVGTGYANTTVTIPGGFWLASFGALFVGIFAAMNPRMAGILGFIYALLQGYVLGAISAAFEAQTEGIVGAAIFATVCVFGVALFLFVTGIIKPTQKMAFGVAAGIGGLCLLYFFVWILALFDADFLYSEEFRAVGIIVTIIAVILAALSFTLDFAVIQQSATRGAPAYMEWYLAWSLMVTIIWLYITLLRLISLLARN